MYKLCKTEQSAARQRELENGLLGAMSVQHYDEISVSDLCQQIGIPRKAFYRYFSGKDGALHSLIDHTLLEYETFRFEKLQGDFVTDQHDLESFFLFWQGKKDLLDALEHSGLCGVLIQRSVDHALSEPGTTSRFLNDYEKNLRVQSTVFAVCGMMSIIVRWHHEGYMVPAEQMAAMAAHLLTRPLIQNAEGLY